MNKKGNINQCLVRSNFFKKVPKFNIKTLSVFIPLFFSSSLFAAVVNIDSSETISGDGTGSLTNPLSSEDLYHIGVNGNGSISMSNGASMTLNRILLGYNAGKTGTFLIDNSTFINTITKAIIGFKGNANLVISNGGSFTNLAWSDLSIAQESGSTATVTITGKGSTLNQVNKIDFWIAKDGYAEINILDGGVINSTRGTFIATNTGNAVVTVDGVGSIFNSAGMRLGNYTGGAAELYIQNGGQVLVSDGFYSDFKVNNGKTIVDGTGSLLSVGGTLTVGMTNENTSGILTASNNAVVKTVANTSGVNNGIVINQYGELNVGSSLKNAATTAGIIDVPGITLSSGTLNLNHTNNDYQVNWNITGNGIVNIASGTNYVSGDNTYSGITNITNGSWYATKANTFSANSDYNIGTSGFLNLAGYSQTISNTTNAGTINFGSNNLGTTLTIQGNYIGNNGTIVMGTNLQTQINGDLLIVNGNTSGNTYVSVTNTGGEGVSTAGLSKGIQLVGVAGESNGQFLLSSPVKSGVYEYKIYRNEDGNWYLSNLDGNNNTGKTIISTTVGSIFGNHQAALNMFSDNEARQTAVRSPDSAFWGYYHFNKLDYDLLGGRMSSNIKTSELVIGADVMSTEQLKVGFYGGYGHASVNNKSSQIGSKSKGSVTGYGIGAYVDWQESLTEGGLSAEALAQYNWFKNDLKDTRDNQKSSYDSQALRLNVGAGYGIVVGRNDLANWILKPQVQLGYTWLSTDDFSDASKVRYSSIDGNGAQFKLGARFYGAKTTSNLAMLPYIEANWIYNSNDGSLKANGQKIDSNIAKNLAEMKAGINGQFSQNWSSYAELNARFGKSDYRRIGAQIGMNYSF